MRRFANPAYFMRFSRQLLPWVGMADRAAPRAGLMLALFVAPPKYQQSESVRIMFIHASAAWMSMFVYATMAGTSAVALIWRHPLADVAAAEAAPLGAAFTLVCLVTGSLWGKPMWATYWVWDARLTSKAVLFFLHLGYLALINAFDDPTRGARAGAILALGEIVNLPIIKFSVDWWNTLHQPASVMRLGRPTIDISMLVPLFVMATAFILFFVTVLLVRMRAAIIGRGLRALRQIHVERPKRFLQCGAKRQGPSDGRAAVMRRLTDFLAIGAYAVFVWPAYEVTILVMAGLVVRSLRRWQRELEMLQRDRPWRNPQGALGA